MGISFVAQKPNSSMSNKLHAKYPYLLRPIKIDRVNQVWFSDTTTILKDNGIKISMDGKDRWMDNVFIERLWRSVKYEDACIKEYVTAEELKKGLKAYFHFTTMSVPISH